MTSAGPAARDLVVMKLLRIALSLLAIAVVAACDKVVPDTLTQANLDRIKDGMSAAEVKSILGTPSDSKSEPIPVVGGTKTTYTYTNKEDRVVIVLKNDTVQSKEGHFGTP